MLPDSIIDQFNFNPEEVDVINALLYVAGILLLTLILRRLLNFLIRRVVNMATKRTTTNLDDRVVDSLRRPLDFLLTVGGIWLALTMIDFPDFVEWLIDRTGNTLFIVGIFWALFRLTDVAVQVIRALDGRIDVVNQTMIIAINQVLKALIVVFAFVVIMQEWGYDMNGLLAGLGIGGLAVALAAQETLSHLVGYVAILADSPFGVGDYIIADDVSGIVEHIGFRSTTIRSLDQSVVYVPNNTIANANLVNWSRLAKRRLNMSLGITYDSSVEQIKAVVEGIRDMLENHEQVLEGSVVVQFVEFNSSSLDIMIICFVDTPGWNEFQAAKENINLKIMEVLAERNVSVAFPTRTIVMEQGLSRQEKEALQKAPLPQVAPRDPDGPKDSPVPEDAPG
jgi:MscS family membrane protein